MMFKTYPVEPRPSPITREPLRELVDEARETCWARSPGELPEKLAILVEKIQAIAKQEAIPLRQIKITGPARYLSSGIVHDNALD